MKYKFKVVDKNDGSCIVNKKSPFYKRYPKDTNVMASEDSLGIMVFNTRQDAETFKQWHMHTMSDFYTKAQNWKVKRVLPIGRGKIPKLIIEMAYTKDIKKLIKLMKQNVSLEIIKHDMIGKWCSPVRGTICYPGVNVVD